MDYEKKYNEALKWIRELYPGLHGATKEDAEHYFPELRESEDEKIRTLLVALVQWAKNFSQSGLDHNTANKMLSYLERQKEQKPAEEIKDQRQIYFMIEDGRRCGVIEGRKQVIDNPEMYGLQKTAEWSEEDEKKIHFLSRLIEFQVGGGAYCFGNRTVSKQEAIEMLQSLRPQPHWKPSEEQMLVLGRFLNFLHEIGSPDFGLMDSLLGHLKEL